MKPKFTWTSDNTHPEIRTGTARWDFGTPGNFVEVKFPDLNEALLIDSLIHQTHSSGFYSGITRLADAIKTTTSKYIEY